MAYPFEIQVYNHDLRNSFGSAHFANTRGISCHLVCSLRVFLCHNWILKDVPLIFRCEIVPSQAKENYIVYVYDVDSYHQLLFSKFDMSFPNNKLMYLSCIRKTLN